jgi:hypothetical protein
VSQERPPELPRVKGRLPFDPAPFRGAGQTGAMLLYGVLAALCAGTAAYMGFQGRALMSGYVVAPAIGALWFTLRLFMLWGRGR